MKINYSTIALLFVFAFINLYFSCQQEVLVSTYFFDEKVELSPARKTYKVGDTLWLSYKNPAKVFTDVPTGKPINVAPAKLQFDLRIFNLYGTPSTAINGFFEISTANGNPIRQYKDTTITYVFATLGCAAGFDLLIAIIPKYKGIYGLDLAPSRYRLSPCSTPSDFPLSEIELHFNLSDYNKDVYQSIPAGSLTSATKYFESLIDQKSMFAFKVE